MEYSLRLSGSRGETGSGSSVPSRKARMSFICRFAPFSSFRLFTIRSTNPEKAVIAPKYRVNSEMVMIPDATL